jgi:hypothetical protein
MYHKPKNDFIFYAKKITIINLRFLGNFSCFKIEFDA